MQLGIAAPPGVKQGVLILGHHDQDNVEANGASLFRLVPAEGLPRYLDADFGSTGNCGRLNRNLVRAQFTPGHFGLRRRAQQKHAIVEPGRTVLGAIAQIDQESHMRTRTIFTVQRLGTYKQRLRSVPRPSLEGVRLVQLFLPLKHLVFVFDTQRPCVDHTRAQRGH